MIERDTNRVPKPVSNPANELLADTIENAGISQATAADRMGVSRSLLNEVIKRKRGVSTDLALRAQALFGIDAAILVKLQSQHDYEHAYHEKFKNYEKSIIPLEIA